MLNEAQIKQYQTEGYVVPVPVMSGDEARAIRRQLERFEATQGGQLQAAQRSRAYLLFEWLDKLIHDPRVLDPVEQLIGPNILCWSSIFWIKEAGSETFVDWHQDNTYWGLSSRNVLTAWFAISDASEEAGCMSVIPEPILVKRSSTRTPTTKTTCSPAANASKAWTSPVQWPCH